VVHDVARLRTLQRTFASRRRDLTERSKGASSRSLVLKGWHEFWIGGLSVSTVAYLFGGVTAATGTTLTSLGLRVLIGIFQAEKQSTEEKAFLNHILATSPRVVTSDVDAN
jgi:hypothetical protein